MTGSGLAGWAELAGRALAGWTPTGWTPTGAPAEVSDEVARTGTSLLGEPTGQGWTQLAELVVALVLSAAIGLERELRRKSAGLRTHALIGFSSALIVLVSKYGFTDVLGPGVAFDPSRVAAQIVSGIGFIGGGLIFVKRDLVRGLTTAAAVWLTTAVGMAAGAGLPVLAAETTAGYFVILYGFTPLSERIRRGRPESRHVEVIYRDGRGLLRTVLNTCTARGWVIARLSTRHLESSIGFPEAGLPEVDLPEVGASEVTGPGTGAAVGGPAVSVVIGLSGRANYADLVTGLTEIDGVLAVSTTSPDDDPDEE